MYGHNNCTCSNGRKHWLLNLASHYTTYDTCRRFQQQGCDFNGEPITVIVLTSQIKHVIVYAPTANEFGRQQLNFQFKYHTRIQYAASSLPSEIGKQCNSMNQLVLEAAWLSFQYSTVSFCLRLSFWELQTVFTQMKLVGYYRSIKLS